VTHAVGFFAELKGILVVPRVEHSFELGLVDTVVLLGAKLNRTSSLKRALSGETSKKKA
jgi:hypothetical protein